MKSKKPTARNRTRRPSNKYLRGWNRQKIQALIDHYENQSEDEAVAEDEAAFHDPHQTMMLVPRSLVPKVQEMIEDLQDTRLLRNSKRRQAGAATISHEEVLRRLGLNSKRKRKGR